VNILGLGIEGDAQLAHIAIQPFRCGSRAPLGSARPADPPPFHRLNRRHIHFQVRFL